MDRLQKNTSKLLIQTQIFTRSMKAKLPSLSKESMIGNESKKVMMDRLQKNKFRDEDDEARLTYKSGERHFECIGVVSSDKIKRHQFMGTSQLVFADPGSPTSQYALSAFIKACHEKK